MRLLGRYCEPPSTSSSTPVMSTLSRRHGHSGPIHFLRRLSGTLPTRPYGVKPEKPGVSVSLKRRVLRIQLGRASGRRLGDVVFQLCKVAYRSVSCRKRMSTDLYRIRAPLITSSGAICRAVRPCRRQAAHLDGGQAILGERKAGLFLRQEPVLTTRSAPSRIAFPASGLKVMR